MTKLQKTIQRRIKRVFDSFNLEQHEEHSTEWLRENEPDSLKLVNKYRRQYNQVWKDELADWAADGPVGYPDFLEHLDSKGIDHSLPTGFEGLIDKDRRWLTQNHEVINGVPSGYMFPKVVMNPRYGSEKAKWVFVSVRADGSIGGHFYTVDQTKTQRKKKFEKVSDLLDNIDAMRKKWLKLIQNFDATRKKTVAAVILELIYTFSARVGTEGNGTSHRQVAKTYGMSTLRAKHFRMGKNGNATLSYLGKDAVKTKHMLDGGNGQERLRDKIVGILRHLAEDKMPRDPLFTYKLKDGRFKPVRNSVVNDLFKELGGGETTVHKLRTYHATKLANELVEEFKTKRKRFNNQKDAILALTKIAEKVGKKLNHIRRTKEGKQVVTGATALANYIDPALQVSFYEHYSIELPKSLQKLI